MLFIFFCYSTLGIIITNGITDPDIKLYGPNNKEIEKGGSVFIDDLVQLEYEGKYCKYRERTLPFSSDKTITDEDVKSCINPKQIYCIDLVADNEQVKLTDSYNGKSHTV